MGDQRIELHYRPAGSSEFKRIRRVDTRGDGTFSFSGLKPNKNTAYRAAFEGDGSDYESSSSAIRMVKVRVEVSLNTSTNPLKRSRARTFSGRVSPGHGGKMVKLTIKRKGRVVATRNVRLDSSSHYRFVYKPNVVGNYQVSASMPNHADHLGATSPIKKFRVTR